MSEPQLFWVSLTAIIATAIANLSIRSLRYFSRHELEEICRRKDNGDRFGEVLQMHRSVDLGIEILATITAAIGVIAGGLWLSQRWQIVIDQSWSTLLTSGVAIGVVLAALVIWIPWAASRIFAEWFLYYTWPLWRSLAAFIAPLGWGAKLIDVVLQRISGRTPQNVDEEHFEEEIRSIVSEGHREGLLEEDAREMIEGVIDLGDADVAEIMTPRTDMHMVSVAMPWEKLIDNVIECGHTRIPVYEKNRDDIVGILYSKDLLPELATGDVDSRTPIRDLLRKPVFVPETKPVDDLLQMFQQMRTHIAVVLDEYGGVSGLVTIEDVLEEIVGEIVDEYDVDVAEEITPIDDHSCEALGRTHIDEINEQLKLQLPEDGDFDTIGGFVFTELGRVPLPGETLVWQEQVRVHVLEASKRRIERVRVERLTDDQRESA